VDLLRERVDLRCSPDRRVNFRPAIVERERDAERLEHEIGFRMVAAERVRYERNLTPPLTNTDEYRAGIADAANIDPLTAAAEIVNP